MEQAVIVMVCGVIMPVMEQVYMVLHRMVTVCRELPPVRQGRPIALGSVSLWGRILARERGYRAQYAYPYELFVIGGNEQIARELRDRYAVDVSLA